MWGYAQRPIIMSTFVCLAILTSLGWIIEMFMNMVGGEKDKEYMGNDLAKRERG